MLSNVITPGNFMTAAAGILLWLHTERALSAASVGVGAKWLARPDLGGSTLALEWPESARFARSRASWRRSLHRTDSSHSIVKAATALHAPKQPLRFCAAMGLHVTMVDLLAV